MPTRGPCEIRWLHLSDFHFRTSISWSQDVVLNTLLSDVASRYGKADYPDLIFLTGDLAFSGRPDEYLLAEDFILKLQDVTGVPAQRLFIVPGNHDIDRSVEEDAFRGVQQALTSQVEVDRFLANEARRRTLFRRQAAFREFANRIAPPSNPYTDSSFAHSKTTKVGPIQITALLLDSAWLAEGGDLDIGRLLVGERQVIDAHDSMSKNGLTFGLGHHPFAWLKDFEQVAVENLLLDRVHMMLRGHVHSADVRTIEALERRLTFFTAGAAFETRTAHNTYTWTTLDLLTGRGVCITHNYVHAAKRWDATEPKPWRLAGPTPVALQEALDIFSRHRARFPAYKAFLLAGHITEVPREISGKDVTLNMEISFPGESNPVGNAISALRHLLTWRSAWESNAWDAELEHQLSQLDQVLHQFVDRSPEVAADLARREQQCQNNLQALNGNSVRPNSFLIENALQLEASGEFDTVLQLIGRARLAGVLKQEELRQLAHVEIRALLGMGNVPSAVSRVDELLASEPPDSEALYLAATCYYDDHRYPNAAQFMHKALDHGVDVRRARRLAHLIAGKCGDKELVERVNKHG